MANKDYNGVSLPDIESVWDKKVYKYATLDQDIDVRTDEPSGRYGLILSDTKGYITEEDETTTVITGNFMYYVYDPDSEKYDWTEMWGNEGDDDSIECITDELLWANYDVLNPDGSVYLKGSGVAYDKQSFLLGLAIGLCRKGGWD